MIRFLVDECVTGHLVTALRQLAPELDVATLPELGLSGLPDPEVLRAAGRLRRVLVTSDRKTMTGHFWRLVAEGLDSPGVVVLREGAPIRDVVLDLSLLADTREDSLDDPTTRVPL